MAIWLIGITDRHKVQGARYKAKKLMAITDR
jgi:hypothetical protein